MECHGLETKKEDILVVDHSFLHIFNDVVFSIVVTILPSPFFGGWDFNALLFKSSWFMRSQKKKYGKEKFNTHTDKFQNIDVECIEEKLISVCACVEESRQKRIGKRVTQQYHVCSNIFLVDDYTYL